MAGIGMSADTVSIIKDVLVALTAVVVAGGAVYGLSTWRRELRGKAKFDVARNVMFYAFKLSADFKYARSPLTSSHEWSGRQRADSESSQEARVLDEGYARSLRLQPLVENLVNSQEAAWEAEIVLDENAGRLVSEAVTLLRKSYAELSSAIHSYFDARLEEARGNPQGDDDHRKWLIGLRNAIYSIGDDNLSRDIEQAIDQLSSALKPYVR